MVKGEITEATPLLVDESSMYILASAVAGATGAPVQLVKIDRATGAVQFFDTGSTFHVHQFAQDASAVYIATDVDTTTDAGTAIVRTSRVVSLAKADGTRADVSPSRTFTTANKLRGGYLGVQTDSSGGDGVYALFEDPPSADGTVPMRVERLGKGGEPTTLFQTQIEASRSALWLLGVVDGAVILARTENDITDAGAGPIRSSSVIVLPASGGAPRIVADFARDYPILGLSALVTDADSVYWLNSSGDLYQLSRGALK